MEWWGYAIVAGSIVSQGLAWAAKLRWSAEYKDAKEAQVKSLEETIKSKDAHITLLEREVKSLQELTPMKMREYLVTTKQTLEEFNNSLQKKIEELQEERAETQRGLDEIGARLRRQNTITERHNEEWRKMTAAMEERFRQNNQDRQDKITNPVSTK